MSNALDLLELIFTHLGSLHQLTLDLILEFLSGSLADGSLLLGDGLNASQMLTKLELSLFSSLIALLLGSQLLVFSFLELLLSLVIDGSLALKSLTTTFLSNSGRNRTNTVS